MFFSDQYLNIPFSYLAIPTGIGSLYILSFFIVSIIDIARMLLSYIKPYNGVEVYRNARKNDLVQILLGMKATILFDDINFLNGDKTSIRIASRILSICFWISVIVHLTKIMSLFH